jgi:hypothetical protein
MSGYYAFRLTDVGERVKPPSKFDGELQTEITLSSLAAGLQSEQMP